MCIDCHALLSLMNTKRGESVDYTRTQQLIFPVNNQTTPSTANNYPKRRREGGAFRPPKVSHTTKYFHTNFNYWEGGGPTDRWRRVICFHSFFLRDTQSILPPLFV